MTNIIVKLEFTGDPEDYDDPKVTELYRASQKACTETIYEKFRDILDSWIDNNNNTDLVGYGITIEHSSD